MNGDDHRFPLLASALVARCAVRPGERVFLLTDHGSPPELTAAVAEAVRAAGACPALRHLEGRERVFADLPGALLDELLSPGLIVDLTSLSWLYSDSLTRYARACAAAGSRLALVLCDRNGLATLLACPPDEALFARARAAETTMQAARTFAIRSALGTDFTAELTGTASFIGTPPTDAEMISAPLYASVTAPFAPGSAHGTLVFIGSGRVQGPEVVPFSGAERTVIEVRDGYVQSIAGEHEVAHVLRRWRAAAPSAEVDRVMDCNLGFDPRGYLAAADNQVIHCAAGGIMIGIGSPYEYRPEGSLRPNHHLDLLFTGCDVLLDGLPIIEQGRMIVPEPA